MLCADGGPIAAVTDGDPAGVTSAVLEPDRQWALRLDAGEHGFDLTFDAVGPTAELGADGMRSHEQLCHVVGAVRIGGRARELRCLGRRGASDDPDWERTESARTIAAWLEDGTGVVLSAVRPVGASDHGRETTSAAVLGPGGTLEVDAPRLSTTYDQDGRQRRAGLELWIGEQDPYPRRAAGEVVCAAALDVGELRLDCAFMRWRMDGRSGAGHYDVLRRA